MVSGYFPPQPSPPNQPQPYTNNPITGYPTSYSSSSKSSSPTGSINPSIGMMPPPQNNLSSPPLPNSTPPLLPGPPPLDPPFRGYIESTLDSLLVFEAARRGMIPRVTRRLIERERGMVQSGAVFVFDEHESGIKRWTDGLVWSPSRILGNFLVYRETGKRGSSTNHSNGQSNSTTGPDGSPSSHSSTDPSPTFGSGVHRFDDPRAPLGGNVSQSTNNRGNSRPGLSAAAMAGLDHFAQQQQQQMHQPPPYPQFVDGTDDMGRPRSASDGGSKGGNFDRSKERQLVGSLTNSYKFKDGGLVKKTMSVNVNGFAQHMVSYYSVEDVLAGRLRTPSTIPELMALEISPEYLHKQNFRFPPIVEVGPDGVPRYRGEPDDPAATYAGTSIAHMATYGQPEPSAYSAPQYEIRDVKYEVAYPTSQSTIGSGNFYDQSLPQQLSRPINIEIPHVQMQTSQSYNAIHPPTPIHSNAQSSWQPPPGCLSRPNAPGMLRQSSEGGLIPSRISRRATPYGSSPITSNFSCASQQQGQSHPRIRRQSNSSSLNSPVSVSFSPANSGNPMISPVNFDFSTPTVPNFPSSQPTQYSTPASGQFYDSPSSAYPMAGEYRNPGLEDSSVNMTSPKASPQTFAFQLHPHDQTGPPYSGWSVQNGPIRPATSTTCRGDNAPASVVMASRNRSFSGLPTAPSLLPLSAENPRRAEVATGIGGGVGMAHSHSHAGSVGHQPSTYDHSAGFGGLQSAQPYEWVVKQEPPAMMGLAQNGIYGGVPLYVGYDEQLGRA